jgi:uncharacterized protein (DUF1810 family)
VQRAEARALDLVHLPAASGPGVEREGGVVRTSRQEAEAYLDHAVLGPRLTECTHLVKVVEGRAIGQILGYPDDLKFRSSMTLFASVASGDQVFKDALEKYFAGEPDPLTLERLA